MSKKVSIEESRKHFMLIVIEIDDINFITDFKNIENEIIKDKQRISQQNYLQVISSRNMR